MERPANSDTIKCPKVESSESGIDRKKMFLDYISHQIFKDFMLKDISICGPSPVQFFFVFMQFLEKIWPNNSLFPCGAPPSPRSGKSWIRHWIVDSKIVTTLDDAAACSAETFLKETL